MSARLDEWRQAPLRDVVSKIVDGSHNPPPKQQSGFPMLSARNVENGRIVFDDFRYIEEAAFKQEIGRTRIVPDDVLLTIVGTIGRAAVVPKTITPFALQRSVAVLSPKPELLPKFLCYQLQAPVVQRYFEENARGTAQKGVYLKTLGATPIVVPAVVAQANIVAEIEKQFSRLDEAVANLERVRANLRRYESASLRAAFEGRLVESEAAMASREDRQFESGEQLLRRIADARLAAPGRRKNFGPSRSLHEVAELPSIPAGWTWARLDDIAAIKGGITVDAKRADPSARRVAYLRVANVQRGYLDLSEMKEIDAPEADIKDLRLETGDLLFNEGGDRDKLGRGWIWEGQLPECIHQNHVFRARLFLKELSPKIVSWWGNTFGKHYFSRQGKQTTNLASINLSKLSAFPVPIPPVAEQHRIVSEVDRRLSVVREVEAEVDANLKRAQSLRQAILAKAFSGAHA